MNDTLDRDGSRKPVCFSAGLQEQRSIRGQTEAAAAVRMADAARPREGTVDAQVVQAATKWKRW